MHREREPFRFYYTSGLAEDLMGYRPGGYHPVHLGDVLSPEPGDVRDGGKLDRRYRVVRKLGYGLTSTAWMGEDMKNNSKNAVSMKITTSNVVGRTMSREAEILRFLARIPSGAVPDSHPGRPHVLFLLDYFQTRGPNGLHDVLVTELLFPLNAVIGNLELLDRKKAAHDVVNGLAFLHSLGIVHGGLHTGNVAFRIPQLSNLSTKTWLRRLDHLDVVAVLSRDFDEVRDTSGQTPKYLAKCAEWYEWVDPLKTLLNGQRDDTPDEEAMDSDAGEALGSDVEESMGSDAEESENVDMGEMEYVGGQSTEDMTSAGTKDEDVPNEDANITYERICAVIMGFGQAFRTSDSVPDRTAPKPFSDDVDIDTPPEILLEAQGLDFDRNDMEWYKAGDVWALGLFIYDLIKYESIFRGVRKYEPWFEQVVAILGPVPDDWLKFISPKPYDDAAVVQQKCDDFWSQLQGDPGFSVMMRSMLRYHPNERAKADDVVKCEYFRELRNGDQQGCS